jgi:5-methylcytosine-specific restriction endonuclease McrA
VRDRECFHETCHDPPDRQQVDHIVEASRGGVTTQDNGRLACGFHNRLRNTRRDDRADSDPP